MDFGLGMLLIILAVVMVWRLIDLFKPKGRWTEEVDSRTLAGGDEMKRIILTLCLLTALLASCAPVDLNAPVPVYDTGIDPNAWATDPRRRIPTSGSTMTSSHA